MLSYIRGRLLRAIPVVFGVLTLVFLMVHLLPGDPAVEIASRGPAATPESIERIRIQLGLDKPLWEQYTSYLGRLARGDLGRSLFSNQPVSNLIADQAPRTFELALMGMATAIVLGVSLGILAAINHNRWLDTFTMVFALIGVSMPSFWLGLLLIFVFAVSLNWVPVAGTGGWQSSVLPSLTLGVASAAIIARLVRSSMLEVLRQEYITTARAKGLAESVVVAQHALKNALIPVVTIVGLQFGNLLGGAVVIETVFARRGIGRMAIDAVIAKDFPVIQGAVLFAALIYVAINLAVDVLYSALDPRIRYD